MTNSRFSIKKIAGRWVLIVDGFDFHSFYTWAQAMHYLITHWECGCLLGEFGWGVWRQLNALEKDQRN